PAQGLARQLYAALRERILDGRLGSRTRMPASRELAQALKVSRNTVVRAYEQLHAEGYIDGRTGDGGGPAWDFLQLGNVGAVACAPV
ncbi:GntR family transcriptional regulator, partial [Pseudomonas aeruginosa]